MKLASMVAVALVTVGAAACKPPAPKLLGPSRTLDPTKVEVTERGQMPLKLKITMPVAAQVAAFFVTPGAPTILLYPNDSSGSAALSAGVNDVVTIYGRPYVTDTTGLLRRPRADTTGQARGYGGNYGGNGGRGGYGGGGRGNNAAPFAVVQSYVLVFASAAPLSYDALQDQVVGMTIPIIEDQAFATITHSIEKTAKTPGLWGAMAVPFGP